MKFGVNIPNFGPGARPESLERWARFTEETGYHFLMTSDHIAITPDVQAQYPPPFYDPFILLGWLSAFTQKVELGATVIIVPYRHPLQTARAATNLNQLSGGRFILGVGAGWAKLEFDALGAPFEQRGAVTNDYLEAIKTYRTNEVATYEGRFISFHNVYTASQSIHAPHPPIWVGGASEAAMRRAVRYGDGWHPLHIRLDWLENEGLPNLRKIAEEAGKPVPQLCPRIKLRLTDSPLPEDKRVAGEGAMDQVRADLERLAALGAKYVLFDTYDGKPESTKTPENDWESLSRLAAQILDLGRQTLR